MMGESYMQMIYIDREDNARHTNVGARMDTNAATWSAFNSCRPLEVAKEKAQFLLDYYNAKGDLSDTICLDAEGFARITGEPVKTDAEYVAIDNAYWEAARAERAAV